MLAEQWETHRPLALCQKGSNMCAIIRAHVCQKREREADT